MMITIGFAGTAKNTGKTTTALHMLGLLKEAGYQPALTSIGYDGENKDHVTGLPKPRYSGEPGMIIATAEQCLGYGCAEYQEICRTGIQTLLGEIIIARVEKPGFVLLAGPNRRADIRRLLEILEEMKTEITFLDGALNRLAAMTLADGVILSTGAAFDEKINTIARHAGAMESLFHYPKFTPETAIPKGISYTDPSGTRNELPIGSIMNESGKQDVASWMEKDSDGNLIIPGVFEPHQFLAMVEEISPVLPGKHFIFDSPLNLLASGFPELWQAGFHILEENGAQISYLNPVSLFFLTVNPFFPKYLQQNSKYVPAFVDKNELLDSVRKEIENTRVVDIQQPPLPDLLYLCKIKPRSRP